MLQGQALPGGREYEEEYQMICRETSLIVNKILELGNGDAAIGIIRGFEAGVIDVPFAPAKLNMGAALPARDNTGAVRFMNCGNLPFDDEVKDFHQKKMQERAKEEKRIVSFQMVIDDIYAIGKGRLTGRPKK
jgi:methylaspartate mutase epsilon subunit